MFTLAGLTGVVVTAFARLSRSYQEFVRRTNIRVRPLGSGFWGRSRMGIRRRVVIATFLPAVAGLSWPMIGSPVAVAQQASCTATGTALTIGAENKKFDKDCLAAPPEQAFTIEFDNRDLARNHNVAIYDTADGNNKELFKGEVVRGPSKTTYSVPAQPKGTYEFVCDPHSDIMRGTFIVG